MAFPSTRYRFRLSVAMEKPFSATYPMDGCLATVGDLAHEQKNPREQGLVLLLFLTVV